MTFFGTTYGGASACEKCPEGYVNSGGNSYCT
jgi:hypothetical protein